jgi:hypothetical protein
MRLVRRLIVRYRAPSVGFNEHKRGAALSFSPGSNRDEVPHLHPYTGCRGHPCRRKRETTAGFTSRLVYALGFTIRLNRGGFGSALLSARHATSINRRSSMRSSPIARPMCSCGIESSLADAFSYSDRAPSRFPRCACRIATAAWINPW